VGETKSAGKRTGAAARLYSLVRVDADEATVLQGGLAQDILFTVAAGATVMAQ
jgi:hypothetical protein